MSESTGKVRNKWGAQVRPFSTYSDDQKNSVLDYSLRVATIVRETIGRDCFIAYGVLLGALREGDFIGHDDDVDLAVWFGDSDRVVVAREMNHLMLCLLEMGFKLNAPAYGQLKVIWEGAGGQRQVVELFACWREEERLFLYFAVDGHPIGDSIEPLEPRMFRDRQFLFPARPDDLLAATYGEAWRIPDPNFSYDMNADKWGSFKLLFRSRNRFHWDRFYGNEPEPPSSDAGPTAFASVVATELEPSSRVLEVGCGDGRDAVFLASQGHDVMACDYSEPALAQCQDRALRAGQNVSTRLFNAYDPSDVWEMGNALGGEFAAVYARFFVHSVSEVGELNLLKLAHSVLEPRGRVFLEFITSEDEGSALGTDLGHGERRSGHFIRFMDPADVVGRAEVAGFLVESCESARGWALSRSQDPVVCRLTLSKRA